MNNHLAKALDAAPEDVSDVTELNKGITNRSYVLTCRGKRYVLRIPGQGTERFISRLQEADTYDAIRGFGLGLEPVYMDPASGYMLTAYKENARTCDVHDPEDVRRCMERLRALHDLELSVASRQDIYRMILCQQALRPGPPAHPDYEQVRDRVFRLKRFVDAHPAGLCLSHNDTVPENFLFAPEGDGEALYLIDWEYACVEDPHTDVAYFAASALYGPEDFRRLLDAYFPKSCSSEIKLKIGCLTVACALYWSCWCECSRALVKDDLASYAEEQYRRARDGSLLLERTIDRRYFPVGHSFLSQCL